MDPAEDLLRRLAFNDEKAISKVLSGRLGTGHETSLRPGVEAAVQLAALLAINAASPLLHESVDQARARGLTTDEIVGVLVAVGPSIGLAALVATAPRLAMALGYDLENGHGREPVEGPSSQDAARR